MKTMRFLLMLITVFLLACDDDVIMPPEGIVHFEINAMIDNDTEDEDQYFDINNDGFNDFRLRQECEGDEYRIELLADCDDEFHFPDGRVSMFLDIQFDSPNMLAFVNRLQLNDVIDESLGIDGGCGHLSYRSDDIGDVELGEFEPGTGMGFIAMQIRNPDGLYHFGWIKVVISGNCMGIQLVDGAYELRQGQAILAGQTE